MSEILPTVLINTNLSLIIPILYANTDKIGSTFININETLHKVDITLNSIIKEIGINHVVINQNI